MTDGLKLRADALRVVQGSGNDRSDSLAAVVPARMRQALPAALGATLGNVVPFLRPRAPDVPAPEVVLPADVARLPKASLTAERARIAAFVLLSIMVHGAVFAYFVRREPVPLASIGIEVISAEILLGDNKPAGAEQTKGKSEITVNGDVTDPQQMDTQSQASAKSTEQPQNVKVGPQETAPEQTTMLERQADERQPADNAAAPQAQPKHSLAMVENPNNPDSATAAPKEIPPDATEVSLLPQPDAKPAEPTATPAPPVPPKPVEQKQPDPKPVKAAPNPVKDAK